MKTLITILFILTSYLCYSVPSTLKYKEFSGKIVKYVLTDEVAANSYQVVNDDWNYSVQVYSSQNIFLILSDIKGLDKDAIQSLTYNSYILPSYMPRHANTWYTQEKDKFEAGKMLFLVLHMNKKKAKKLKLGSEITIKDLVYHLNDSTILDIEYKLQK